MGTLRRSKPVGDCFQSWSAGPAAQHRRMLGWSQWLCNEGRSGGRQGSNRVDRHNSCISLLTRGGESHNLNCCLAKRLNALRRPTSVVKLEMELRPTAVCNRSACLWFNDPWFAHDHPKAMLRAKERL